MWIYVLLNLGLILAVAALLPTFAHQYDDPAKLREELKKLEEQAKRTKKALDNLKASGSAGGSILTANLQAQIDQLQQQNDLLQANNTLSEEGLSNRSALLEKELSSQEQILQSVKDTAGVRGSIKPVPPVAVGGGGGGAAAGGGGMAAKLSPWIPAVTAAAGAAVVGLLGAGAISKIAGGLAGALPGGSGGVVKEGFKTAVGFTAVKKAIGGVQEVLLGYHARLDDTLALTRRATGLNTQYNSGLAKAGGQVQKLIEALHRQGVAETEATKMAESLISAYRPYVTQTAGARKTIEGLAIQLGALGVSGADAAKGLDEAHFALGLTSAETDLFTRRQIALADKMTISHSQMAADFARVGDQMAQFGSNGRQVFLDMEVVQRRLGIAIDKQMAAAKSFSDIEAAANAAATLSSYLGGAFVDDTKLLQASVTGDVMGMYTVFHDAMKQSGKDWEDLGELEKRGVAQAMNMSVGEAARVMQGNFTEMAETARDVTAVEFGTPGFEKGKTEAQTMGMKFGGAGAALKQAAAPVGRGLVEAQRSIADQLVGIAKNTQPLDGSMGRMIDIIETIPTTMATVYNEQMATNPLFAQLAASPLGQTFEAVGQVGEAGFKAATGLTSVADASDSLSGVLTKVVSAWSGGGNQPVTLNVSEPLTLRLDNGQKLKAFVQGQAKDSIKGVLQGGTP